MIRWLWLALLLGMAVAGVTQPLEPGQAALFAYQPRPGSLIPPQLRFQDADGTTARLGDLASGAPLILVPAYFHCPNLCGVTRASLFAALRATDLRAGYDYAVAVLSIDPSETRDDAQAAKARDTAAFPLPGADRHWHYLTGRLADIQALADAIGFRDRLDLRTKQYIHPAGIVFLTRSGSVSSYLLGVGYTPAQIRSALRGAGEGRVAAVASPLLLLCFHFDASTGRYSLEIMKVIRLAACLTMLAGGGVLLVLFRRERSA